MVRRRPRNREGSIGKNLKQVHWIMLCIIWWRLNAAQYASGSTSLCTSFLWFLHFYRELPFASVSVGAWMEPEPIVLREETAAARHPPLWLDDPFYPATRPSNLAARVDVRSFRRIQAALRDADHPVRQGFFWGQRMGSWRHIQATQYGCP